MFRSFCQDLRYNTFREFAGSLVVFLDEGYILPGFDVFSFWNHETKVSDLNGFKKIDVFKPNQYGIFYAANEPEIFSMR